MTFSRAAFSIATATLLTLSCINSSRAQAPDILTGANAPANGVWLDSLNLAKMSSGWMSALAGHSVGKNPITLDGVTYIHGVGTHAISDVTIDLHGDAARFESEVGVDDEATPNGSVVFNVFTDGKLAKSTGVIHRADKPQFIDVNLNGVKKLKLQVTDADDGIDNDHADWAGAAIIMAGAGAAKPETIVTPPVPVVPPRMTYPAFDPRPEIHGPQVLGTTPGRPFLYMIPATGAGTITFSAHNLPKGLALNKRTGIVTGSLAKPGTTMVEFTASNDLGKATRKVEIVGGVHKLALTPPMGWNSWNVWADQVDDPKVRAAADSLVSSGLAAHGFQYVNIDDTWESAKRDDQGRIHGNAKFPNMSALSSYVHSKGLRIGIYSSPGPTTCGGYLASFQHEDQDAQTYSDWGFDYLKYDSCSYDYHGDYSTESYEKPYAKMRASLDKVQRDILYSFCQYGMGGVSKWGTATGGNCWRTTGDITDNWRSMLGNMEQQNGLEQYAGPGHWNDPDMLVVGVLGWGNQHPTKLTPNEQLMHITQWCMIASPLLIGCDMTKLDKFTLAILTNDEALDIDQDPLGKAAGRVSSDSAGGEVWARPLADGTHAVSLLNTGETPMNVTAKWADIGVNGKQPVRDLWLHKNVGSFNNSYTVMVPSHGVVLVKVGKPNNMWK